MAPKSKPPAGELTSPELRKLIRAHNILSKIVIPKGTDRQGLIKLIEGKNFIVDHEKKVIRPSVKRGKQITLKKAEEITKPKPVSEAVKKQRAEKKKEKEESKQKDIKIAKKEAVQEFKSKKKEAEKVSKKLNKKKDLKLKSISNNKEDMKRKQLKETQKLKSQKEDEVRPKEKVGRPKVDPKKIKVIEPKKETKETPFTGIRIIGSEIKVKNSKEVLDYINSKFKLVKQPNNSQISKIDSLFKLTDINPKYVSSILIGETLGDQYVDTEGLVYIQPFYMKKGPNEVPDNLETFKFIKFKGEPVKVDKKKKVKKIVKKLSKAEEYIKGIEKEYTLSTEQKKKIRNTIKKENMEYGDLDIGIDEDDGELIIYKENGDAGIVFKLKS